MNENDALREVPDSANARSFARDARRWHADAERMRTFFAVVGPEDAGRCRPDGAGEGRPHRS